MRKFFSFLRDLPAPFIGTRTLFGKLVLLVAIFSLLAVASIFGIFSLQNVTAQGSINSENQIERDGSSNLDVECKDHGFDFGIAKWEWEDESWQVENNPPFPLADYNTFVSGDDQASDWTSDPIAAGVVAKTATDSYVFDGGISGQINNTDTGNHDISHITFCGNESESETQTATIIAHKVVCDSEELLPNLEERSPNITINNITSTTASTFASGTDGCELVEDWDFEYKITDDQSNPGGNTVGPKGGDWTTFTNTTEIPIDDLSLIQLREVLPSGYIPFSDSDDGVSAEFYCRVDVSVYDSWNYDNWEFIKNPQDKETYYCVGFNVPKPSTDNDLTIVGTKIMCDSETYLPNWGDGSSGPITATTATDWLSEGDNSEHCQIVPWDFEWSPADITNPGDNQGLVGGDWTQFSGSTTISSLEDIGDKIWVREDWNNTLVPFTGLNTDQDESAEIYCHTDVLHYDNYDFIVNPELGETYYCVAWNAPAEVKEPLICEPGVNLLINSGFEEPVVNNSAGWDIFDSGTLGLGWIVKWVYDFAGAPEIAKLELHRGLNGWLPSAGNQYAELDTDWDGPDGSINGEEASVSIYQNIPTVSGKTYNLSYDFSPRPDTPTTTQNVLEVLIDDSLLDTHTAVGLSQTSWTSHSLNFTGTGEPTKIEFRDGGTPDSLGTFLDNTSLICEEDCKETIGTISSNSQTEVTNIVFDLNDSDTTPDYSSLPVSVVTEIQTLGDGVWAADVGDLEAEWIWSNDPYDPDWEVDKWVTFKRVFEVSGIPQVGALEIAADNSYEVWINGNPAGSDSSENNHSVADSWDITGLLVDGSNTLEVRVKNWALPGSAQESNPGGLLYSLSWGAENCDNSDDEEIDPPNSGGGSGDGNSGGGSSSSSRSGDFNRGGGGGSFLPSVAGAFTEGAFTQFPESQILGTTIGLPNTGRAEENFKNLVFVFTLILGTLILLTLNYQVLRKIKTKKSI